MKGWHDQHIRRPRQAAEGIAGAHDIAVERHVGAHGFALGVGDEVADRGLAAPDRVAAAVERRLGDADGLAELGRQVAAVAQGPLGACVDAYAREALLLDVFELLVVFPFAALDDRREDGLRGLPPEAVRETVTVK